MITTTAGSFKHRRSRRAWAERAAPSQNAWRASPRQCDHLVQADLRSSASPPGSVIAAVSVLVPMQQPSLCEIRVIIAAQPGSGPNGYMCVIRDPAMYTGYGTPGTLDTCTSLVLVSRPETARDDGRGQPAERRGERRGHRVGRGGARGTGGQHELPHGGDPGGRVGLGHGRGEPGTSEAVAALRVVLGAQADRESDGEPVDPGAVPLVVAAEPADHGGQQPVVERAARRLRARLEVGERHVEHLEVPAAAAPGKQRGTGRCGARRSGPASERRRPPVLPSARPSRRAALSAPITPTPSRAAHSTGVDRTASTTCPVSSPIRDTSTGSGHGWLGPMRVVLGAAAVQPRYQLDRAEPVGHAVVALDDVPGPAVGETLDEQRLPQRAVPVEGAGGEFLHHVE